MCLGTLLEGCVLEIGKPLIRGSCEKECERNKFVKALVCNCCYAVYDFDETRIGDVCPNVLPDEIPTVNLSVASLAYKERRGEL